MIIKSLSRKKSGNSCSQLYDYIQKGADEDATVFLWNLPYFDDSDREGILNHFDGNMAKLADRKNGNFLYHEIISLHKKPGISIEYYQQALNQLAYQYMAKRGDKLLAFGKCHVDRQSVHMHLIISANELGSEKRFRLSKSEFSQIQKELEQNVLKMDLKQEKVYSKDDTFTKVKESEFQLKRRTGLKSKRENLKELLSDIFKYSQEQNQLISSLEKYEIGMYSRGNQVGITYKSRRYRLNRLGLDKEYQRVLERFYTSISHEFDVKKEETPEDYQKKIADELQKLFEKNQDDELEI